jgi:hypothetical protein
MIGLRFPAGVGNFSLRHRVKTDCGSHPAFYPMTTGVLSPVVKRPGREADHSPPSSAEVKEWVALYLQSQIRLHVVVFSLNKKAQGKLYLYLTYECFIPYVSFKNSSVGIALGYRLDDRGSSVRFPAGAENFSLHHRVQNCSGAHPASYPMGTRGSFLGGKAVGAWSWPLTSS